MPSARSLLNQLKRHAASRESPVIAHFGTPEFEAQIRAEVAEGKLDGIDMLGANGTGGVLAALQKWAQDRVWEGWR